MSVHPALLAAVFYAFCFARIHTNLRLVVGLMSLVPTAFFSFNLYPEIDWQVIPISFALCSFLHGWVGTALLLGLRRIHDRLIDYILVKMGFRKRQPFMWDILWPRMQ